MNEPHSQSHTRSSWRSTALKVAPKRQASYSSRTPAAFVGLSTLNAGCLALDRTGQQTAHEVALE